MRIGFSASQRSSLGVEWELELVDLDTGELSAGADEILAELAPAEGVEHPKAKHELLQSCVEVITGVCTTVAQARDDLAGTVAEVKAAAARRNLGVLCSGTHPTTHWSTQQISAGDRYRMLVERNQRMAQQLQIFGVHVHVGVRSEDKVMPIVNALLDYVPHLLALSASSPFWLGGDTGLASYRSKIFEACRPPACPTSCTTGTSSSTTWSC
jgi:carboxylate-amine ligase